MSIQSQIDSASSGDTVEVGAGTYNEKITIDKEDLTLKSKPSVAAKNVKIDNFQIKADGVTVSGVTAADPQNNKYGGFAGAVINDDGDGDGELKNVRIDNSRFLGGVRPEVDLNGFEFINNVIDIDSGLASIFPIGSQNNNNRNLKIKDNTIDASDASTNFDAITFRSLDGDEMDAEVVNNTITGVTAFDTGTAIFLDIDTGSTTSITIKENELTNNGIGIDVGTNPAKANSPTVNGVQVNNNTISGNSKSGIRLDGSVTGTLDATDNWWGDPSGPSNKGPGSGDAVSAGVNFDPFLNKLPLDSGSGDVPDALFENERLDENNKFLVDTTGNGKETAEDDKRLAILSEEGRLDNLSTSEQNKLDYDGDGEVTFDDIVTKVFERKGLL